LSVRCPPVGRGRRRGSDRPAVRESSPHRRRRAQEPKISARHACADAISFVVAVLGVCSWKLFVMTPCDAKQFSASLYIFGGHQIKAGSMIASIIYSVMFGTPFRFSTPQLTSNLFASADCSTSIQYSSGHQQFQQLRNNSRMLFTNYKGFFLPFDCKISCRRKTL
jgi:hypothetical protein